MNLVGIEIGGTKLQVVVGDREGRITDRRRFGVERSAGGEGIRARLSDALNELLPQYQPSAIGVGFGGPVDWRTGRIACSHQIAGWHNFELGQWLRDLTGRPVHIDNDANVAALGEALYGAGRGYNPVFWINMGSGVGGGLIVDGHLYHGATPGEAEIGHVRLDKAGTLVEHRCSGWAVDQRIRQAVTLHPNSPLGELCEGSSGGEARHLPSALAAQDELAHAILSELADNLAFGLSHVIHLFHPEIVVVGGGLSLVGEPLREALASAIPQYLMESFQPGPVVRLAGLGEDSVPMGALALASRSL
jgi:glucokinase